MLRYLAVIVLATGFAACGDDGGGGGSDGERYCGAVCDTLNRCDLLSALMISRGECVSSCVAGDGEGSECNPTASQADACIAAASDLACGDLLAGNVPPECDLCDVGE